MSNGKGRHGPRRNRWAAVAIAAALAGSIIPLGAIPAGAAVRGGRSIEVFTGTNLVALTGYPPRTRVEVRVLRQGFEIGSTTKTTGAVGTELEGAIELNHVGGSDCFDPPHSPDIVPGDEIRTTIRSGALAGTVDSSVVRGVWIDDVEYDTAADTITVSGRVSLEGRTAVQPGVDVLELRINKDSDWDVNDRPGRRDRRVDIGANVQADGTWIRVLRASHADVVEAEASSEIFLEWSAGGLGGGEEAEEVEPSELTVWDDPGGEAIDCPPFLTGPTAPALRRSDDTRFKRDHITRRSTDLDFAGITNEVGANASVRLFVDGIQVAEGTADGTGRYEFLGRTLRPRARPYRVAVEAQAQGQAPFMSADRMVTIDTRRPAVGFIRKRPRILRLRGTGFMRLAYRIGEASRVKARVRNSRGRLVRSYRARNISRARRVRYRWNGKNGVGRNVRPGTYRMVLKVTDLAGNIRKRTKRMRVVR